MKTKFPESAAGQAKPDQQATTGAAPAGGQSSPEGQKPAEPETTRSYFSAFASGPAGFFGIGIRQTGFKNIVENGSVTGFQVQVVNGYYRGTYAALYDYFDVTVDGEKFPRESITCTFETGTITQDKLYGSKLRWPYTEPCILTVKNPGGLAPGFHNVTVDFLQRISYMPIPRQITTFSAKLVMVV
jgi:hypothetical protein